MLYRRFGRTELQMPVFSTGGMRYQDGWKDKPLEEIPEEIQANLEATIQRSIDVGINHIETARGYGPSERQLGLAFPKYPRESLIIQTKVGPSADADEFEANFLDSLDRLQLDYVDLFSIHGINNPETLDWAARPGGCMDKMYRLRDQGKCRFLGFSTHGEPSAMIGAIRAHRDRGRDFGFDYFNVHWYFILRRNWEAILAAYEQDMGIFIISPTDKGGHLHTPTDRLRSLCEPLDPIVFNDLWCLGQTHPSGAPAIHTLSLGASKPSDYDKHLEAVALFDQRDALLPPIVERFAMAMREASGHDSPEYGLDAQSMPEIWDMPGEANVRITLWLYNLARAWGMGSYAKARFNLMGNAGHWFPGCLGTDIPQVSDAELREACKNSPIASEIPALLKAAVAELSGTDVKRMSEA